MMQWTPLTRQEAERKGIWCLSSIPTASPMAQKENMDALNGVAL